MAKTRQTLKVNARSIRQTLSRKDYLISTDQENLRREILVIHITGAKGVGKTRLSDQLFALLQSKGYSVVLSRPSRDAEKHLTDHRKNLTTAQEMDRERYKWYEVVDSLRAEGASALERKVIPIIREKNTSSNKKIVLIMTRYPFLDTLVKQGLLGYSLDGVSQYLRGIGEKPSGYILPDISFVVLCNGMEVMNRLLRTSSSGARYGNEKALDLDPKFLEVISRENETYKVLGGFASPQKPEKKAIPGCAVLVDTSTGLDYSEIDTKKRLEENEIKLANTVCEDYIIPILEGKNGDKVSLLTI